MNRFEGAVLDEGPGHLSVKIDCSAMEWGPPEPKTFDHFLQEMRAILEPTAAGKGYNTTGIDGENALYAFVADTVGGPGHAIGEAIYKVKRYAAKRNPEDLIKLASWAYLMWKHHK